MNISATNRRKYSENYGVHIEEGATVSAVQALDPAKSQAGGEELRVWFSVTRGGGGTLLTCYISYGCRSRSMYESL